MARYTIQAALMDKEFEETSARGMVDKAHSAGLLSEIAKNRCKACVSMGNSGSHPQYNLLKAIGPEDAIEAVRLARRVLLELYEPASITDED